MSRLERLSEWLADEHCAALITSAVSLRYLSGFNASEGVMLVTNEQSYYLVSPRCFEQAKRRVSCCRVMLMQDMRTQLLELLLKHNIKRVLIESDSMTVRELETYKDGLPCAEFDSGSSLSDELLSMRLIKSDEEIRLITKAQRIAEKAYERLLGTIRCGMTEKQAAALLSHYIMDYGADEPAFPTAAASGDNSSFPDALPTDRQLRQGDFLTLEFGAVCDGCHSVMARTVAVGTVSPKMEEAYNAVYSAVIDSVRVLRAGVGGKVVDSVARSTLNAWGGLDKYFTHGLGYGVGLSAYEAPFLSQSSNSMLRAGMVIAVGPGIYANGMFGIRIKDMAVITENGCENLTNTTKNLVHI